MIVALWFVALFEHSSTAAPPIRTPSAQTPSKAKKTKTGKASKTKTRPLVVPAKPSTTPATPKPSAKPPTATPKPTPTRPVTRPSTPTGRPGSLPAKSRPSISSGRPTSAPIASRATSPSAVRSTARETIPSRAVPTTTVTRTTTVPLYRSTDHRFARPDPFVVQSVVVRPAPVYRWYRPYWTHWWVHPYWRWTHATVVVVGFGYAPAPWDIVWVPPPRAGWVWVPGHRGPLGRWWPGHWAPVGSPPVAYGGSWVYVPGWWMGTAYAEGYWRVASRPGWRWMDGYYLDDGSYIRGWWVPEGSAPRSGYVWEGGYWDGEYWVEGFWRPSQRSDYRWVSSWLDSEGVFHAGYWEPTEDKPGMVWIPGWFDGDNWVEGYWVDEPTYRTTDPETWKPDEGWDKQRGDGEPLPDAPASEGEAPLALPVRPG